MSMFDDLAKHAAIETFLVSKKRGVVDSLSVAHALSAAEQSMRERGLCFDDTMNFWAPDEDKFNAMKLEHDLPVTIIRKETP
jgi:hypothetical protein